MPLPRSYQNFAEFEREILRPSRVGFSLEDIVEDEGSFDAELDFEKDPFDVSDND
ncbi:transcriptional regulator [Sorangium sp. So ce118]